MNANLLEIEPEELSFIYEPKKQSSCSVRLINNSHKHVAFKVKTTAPKKYCVRPNVGIIMPKSTWEFTVIMQAQGSALPDLVCKDKFLIQSTIVSGSTTNEEVTRDMFVKGGNKYIEERKLKVSLITPPHSPIPSPMNGKLKQDQLLARVEIVTPGEKIAKNGVLSTVTSGLKLNPMKDVESTAKIAEIMTTMDANLKPQSERAVPIMNAELSPAKDARSELIKNAELSPTKDAKLEPAKDEGLTFTKNTEPPPTKVVKLIQTEDEGSTLTKTPTKVAKFNPTEDEGFALPKNAELTPAVDEELTTTIDDQLTPVKVADLVPVNDVQKLELVKCIEDLKSKLIELESKLSKAEATISKLTEEIRLSKQDSQNLRKEIEWRGKRGAVRVKEGYPLLFVCMVALLCIVLGYRLQSGM